MEEQRNQQRPAEMEEQQNQLKPAEREKQHQQLRNQMEPAETEKEQQQRQHRVEEDDTPREKRREQEQTLQNHSVSVPTPSPPPSANTQSSESYKDPKRRSPSSDSPISSDNSSLSHGSSPRGPPQSQPSYPSYPNSLPPVSTLADVKAGSESPDFVATVEVEEQKVNSGSGRRLRPDLSILRRTKREKMVKRILLGFRTCGFACCLVAFSVLAADKDQGWALDSFYRYREFRYSMAVTVIGFVYSAFQAYGLAYGLATSKQKTRPRLRYYLDFSLDQIVSYLLLSASSSAAVRVDDWQLNWGEDKFPEMAKASVALSFVAFISMALSSVVSGYTLCTLKSI
ncbi:hypothetical protein SLE2022_193220 [Rubroshorea leprosula]